MFALLKFNVYCKISNFEEAGIQRFFAFEMEFYTSLVGYCMDGIFPYQGELTRSFIQNRNFYLTSLYIYLFPKALSHHKSDILAGQTENYSENCLSLHKLKL